MQAGIDQTGSVSTASAAVSVVTANVSILAHLVNHIDKMRPLSDYIGMSENLTQLLLKRSDWFADEIMRGIQRSPWPHITPAQSRLLALMGGKSASMAELGRRLAISRQAVHKTVNELVRQGILEVKVDPERGNAKLVSYTETGREINRAGAKLIEEAELKLANKIGPTGVEQLKQLLRADWDDADSGASERSAAPVLDDRAASSRSAQA